MQIKILRNVMEANEAIAAENRRLLKSRGIHTVNFIASPGAGKTTLLEKTIDGLEGRARIGVIEGDIAGSADAERIASHRVPVVQLNTGGDCHLNASMVRSGLESLPLDEIDLLFIENVGNLVCPAGFDIGEDEKVVVLSVAEGDDKPAKYPLIFQQSAAMVLNKIDLLGMVDFDVDKALADARSLNPLLPIFQLSARNRLGMDEWTNWLRSRAAAAGRPSDLQETSERRL